MGALFLKVAVTNKSRIPMGEVRAISSVKSERFEVRIVLKFWGPRSVKGLKTDGYASDLVYSMMEETNQPPSAPTKV